MVNGICMASLRMWLLIKTPLATRPSAAGTQPKKASAGGITTETATARRIAMREAGWQTGEARGWLA